ncbi:MAG: ubiquinone biosynthesis accessory factor UbiK [Methylohalobius sp.]
MFDPRQLDDLAQRLAGVLPEGLKQLREDLEKNFRAVLQSAFSQMNLVSREEFEVQAALLKRTREKLDALEAQIRELEQKLRS